MHRTRKLLGRGIRLSLIEGGSNLKQNLKAKEYGKVYDLFVHLILDFPTGKSAKCV